MPGGCSGPLASSAPRRRGSRAFRACRRCWSRIPPSPFCSRTRPVGSVAVRVWRCYRAASCISDPSPGLGRVRRWFVTSPIYRPRSAAWDVGEVFAAVEYQLDLDLDAPAPADTRARAARRRSASVDARGRHGRGRHGRGGGTGCGAPRRGRRAARGRGAPRRWRGQHLGREGRVSLGQSVPSGHGRFATARRRAGRPDLGRARDHHRPRRGRDARRVVGDGPGARCRPTRPRGAHLPLGPVHAASRAAARSYEQLAAALQPLYASAAVPLSPARAAADLGATRPDGALVLADPGPAGLWVARALPTTELGSVVVPSLPRRWLRHGRRARGLVRRANSGRGRDGSRRPSDGRAARARRALGRGRHARGLGRRRRHAVARGAGASVCARRSSAPASPCCRCPSISPPPRCWSAWPARWWRGHRRTVRPAGTETGAADQLVCSKTRTCYSFRTGWRRAELRTPAP